MRRVLKATGVMATMMIVLFSTATARASTIEVRVPFPFEVQDRLLPPGEYRVTNESGVVQLMSENGAGASLYLLATPVGGADPAGHIPALTFTRDKSHYRLSTIWESPSEALEPVSTPRREDGVLPATRMTTPSAASSASHPSTSSR